MILDEAAANARMITTEPADLLAVPAVVEDIRAVLSGGDRNEIPGRYEDGRAGSYRLGASAVTGGR